MKMQLNGFHLIDYLLLKKLVKEDLVLYTKQFGWMAYEKLKKLMMITTEECVKHLASLHLRPGQKFENHMKCILNDSRFKIYGLTQSSKNNKYFIVLQYADNGNLHNFLRTKFQEVNWQSKLNIFFDISKDLSNISYSGYIHADFHSGNILQNKGTSTTLHSYIADLGLTKKANKNDSEGEIFEIIPYVAPEVLFGQKVTKAADIYSFGVIMSEMSTGQRPFDVQEFDHKLAIKICKRLRPEFAPRTPKYYIELAKKCMN
ncbi:kinase-like domain-containing protein [Gigaspora rosea]|uniref:Kinase-like domain-containing protein n=1 Tax=Gigaspora rosea TaxID=44941 RepID=A0A397TSL0_9GLOM|nr:kinase-like domain-containing protein [Gigaspora rosea]